MDKKRNSIPNRFRAIHKLPLEVSFDQVRTWVDQYQPKPAKPSFWKRFFFSEN